MDELYRAAAGAAGTRRDPELSPGQGASPPGVTATRRARSGTGIIQKEERHATGYTGRGSAARRNGTERMPRGKSRPQRWTPGGAENGPEGAPPAAARPGGLHHFPGLSPGGHRAAGLGRVHLVRRVAVWAQSGRPTGLSSPHLSATIIIAVTGMAIVFVAGARIWHFLALVVGAGGLMGVYILFSGHVSTRLKVWLDPFIDPLDKGYQAVQSFLAIGSGGFWGVGLGRSR